jgi:hypothetical protein
LGPEGPFAVRVGHVAGKLRDEPEHDHPWRNVRRPKDALFARSA